jgi:ribosomal protein L29
MKLKELNSLRNKEIQELQKLLSEKKIEALQAKAGIKVSKEKNLKHVKMLKRDISQIFTILSEKKFMEAESNKKKTVESES